MLGGFGLGMLKYDKIKNLPDIHVGLLVLERGDGPHVPGSGLSVFRVWRNAISTGDLFIEQ